MIQTVVLKLASELLAANIGDYLKNADVILGTGDDDLQPFTVPEKAQFYRRLANYSLKKDPESLAGILLLHWLDGNGVLKRVKSDRIKNLSTVRTYMLDEVRAVFLSQKEAFINKKRDGIKGIKPRLTGVPNFPQWDGNSPMDMTYSGPAFDVVTLSDFIDLQEKLAGDQQLSEEELLRVDVFTSLHSSGLKTDVRVSIQQLNPRNYLVSFLQWSSNITDNYNWTNEGNPLAPKRLTLFNPDFGNPDRIPKPVSPSKEVITIFHRNALEVERAGLAKSFDFETDSWDVTDPAIIADSNLNV